MTSISGGVRMSVVAEPPWRGEWTPPWAVSIPRPGEWIALHGGATPAEVGVVAMLLVSWNEVPGEGSARDVVRVLAEKEKLWLPGGIHVSDAEGNQVGPGCCCEVKGWREWLSIADGESSPWMGHSPWGWVEHSGDVVRVCSATESFEEPSGHGPAENVVVIARAELPRLLEGVRADLEGFAARLREWAAAIDPEAGERVAERFAASFVHADPLP